MRYDKKDLIIDGLENEIDELRQELLAATNGEPYQRKKNSEVYYNKNAFYIEDILVLSLADVKFRPGSDLEDNQVIGTFIGKTGFPFHEGDRVYRVNGKVIAEEPFEEAVRIIAEEKTKGPLTIGVLRPYICYNRKFGRLLFAAIIIFLLLVFWNDVAEHFEKGRFEISASEWD